MTLEPLTTGVNIEPFRPDEPEQCHPALARPLDGETRRRADRRNNRNSRHERLLNQLEAHSSADDEDALMSWQSSGEELTADDLVEGVMTPDILAHGNQPSVEIEQRRSVQAAGGRDQDLLVAQQAGERPHQSTVDDWLALREHPCRCRVERASRRFATRAAAGAGVRA